MWKTLLPLKLVDADVWQFGNKTKLHATSSNAIPKFKFYQNGVTF